MNATVQHPHAWVNTWGQVLLFLVVQISGLIWFLSSVNKSQDEFRETIKELSANVKEMGTEVQHLANAYERLDEHTKSAEREVNRRLDTLEKDSQVKEWRQK